MSVVFFNHQPGERFHTFNGFIKNAIDDNIKMVADDVSIAE